MSVTDEILHNAESYHRTFDRACLVRAPARELAIVTCMDARIDPYAILGLREGDAHMIRNAGGVISDGVIRSLAISQRKMGTREIIVIQHTDCGMKYFSDEEFRRELETETGVPVPWDLETFTASELDVKKAVARIVESPFIPHRDQVRGFVYEVESGLLREVR